MNCQRTLVTIRSGLFVGCLLTATTYEADAQVFAPTKEGLQQLVLQDAAMLPTPYATKLRKKLSDWEHGVGVKCYNFPNRSPICSPEAKDVIADIQVHIFMIDGFVIDSDEWSDNIPSPEIPAPGGGLMPSGLPVALSQIFPKVVSSQSPAAKSFNTAAKQFGLSIWRNMGGPPRSNPEGDKSRDFEIDYAQNNNPLPGVISISYSWGDYSHGAAHGEFGGYDFNWNVAQKRPLEVGDLFNTKTDWEHGLATAILAAFQNSNQDYFANSTADDIVGEVSDPTRWAVTKVGLRVDTDAYEVGGYSYGAPSAVASWSSLKPYLKRGGLVDP
jgi:hypothetical protein